MSSIPAFQWDKWYEAIGGRKISITLVDELLHQIHHEQYPRFEGEVNSQVYPFASTSEASTLIKNKALALGADLVGICAIDEGDVYEGRVVKEQFAIALGQAMEYEHFSLVPTEQSAIECMRIYHSLGEIVIALAQYIRELGYPCRIEHPLGDSDLLHIPIALKAGFGELGRHGSIINPELGPLFRIGSIVTDMPLQVDQPMQAGIADFCDHCHACEIYCPAGAIPATRSTTAGKTPQGNYRFVVDTGRCFPYFAHHQYCSACLAVCVYNRKSWALDFNGKAMSYPEVMIHPMPDEVDSVPEAMKHSYPLLNRGIKPTFDKANKKYLRIVGR